jgi:prevent-host-death family protein
MATVSVHEAKTHLSRLINDVLAGKEVIVSRGKQEVVRIVPMNPLSQKRKLGLLRDDSSGRDPLAYGFWDPIPDTDLALWNGEVDYSDDAPAS